MIGKGERAELRSIVKQQFKVLRAEILQRAAEMNGQVDEEVAARYADRDQEWTVAQHEIHEAVMAANRAINDALANHGFQVKSGTERLWLTEPRMAPPDEDKHELRRTAYSRISVQARDAQLRLDRQEADLLRDLSVNALESEEARAWLSAIPTVGELVPGARLAELEASMKDDEP